LERLTDAYRVRELIKQRHTYPKTELTLLKNRGLIQQTLSSIRGKESSDEEVKSTIKWLEKVSKYVPIGSDKELEEIIKIMVLLSQERAKLNIIYNKSGLNLMKRVREGMIRYMIVLSELRARREEYLEYWFSDEYWIAEWSRILLDLPPDGNMVKYGFDDVKARDFLFLLELELAAADDASQVKRPLVRLQPIENKDAFLIIPTEIAAEEYKVQVDHILEKSTTFTQWVSDTLKSLKLPK
jgi:hypothetical protein